MANVDESINLGNVDPGLEEAVRNQFENLYTTLAERWEELSRELNHKPDVVINKSNATGRSPPDVTLTQYGIRTIYIDLVPTTPTVWQLVDKQFNAMSSQIESVWIQLG